MLFLDGLLVTPSTPLYVNTNSPWKQGDLANSEVGGGGTWWILLIKGETRRESESRRRWFVLLCSAPLFGAPAVAATAPHIAVNLRRVGAA